MRSVLFVCTGNICRSPTAEGVFRKMVVDGGLSHLITADSAGTVGYHVGEPPDPRSQAAAARRGYELARLRARRVVRTDFERFDLVLAMDFGHREVLARLAPEGGQQKLRMLLEYAQAAPSLEVPDPYYGGPQGFEVVLDLIEDASRGLLAAMRAELSAG